MAVTYEKVVGRRIFDFVSKKDKSDHTACIIGLIKPNTIEGSVGVSCREIFIDSRSNAYATACSLNVDDYVLPIEQNGFVQDFLIKEKKEK